MKLFSLVISVLVLTGCSSALGGPDIERTAEVEIESAGSDANSAANSDANINAGSFHNAFAYRDPNLDANTNANTTANVDSNPNPETNAVANSDSNPNTNSHPGSALPGRRIFGSRRRICHLEVAQHNWNRE
jgi:hypothetical protein